MPFLNFNNYPSSVSGVISTYTKDRNNIYYATSSGLYKYDFAEKTDNLVASLNTSLCFFEDDYFYRYYYEFPYSSHVKLYLYKYSLDGSLISYIYSGSFKLTTSVQNFYSKLIVDKFNKIAYVVMKWIDGNVFRSGYHAFNYTLMTNVNSEWSEFTNLYSQSRDIIYSNDGVNAYDVNGYNVADFGLFRIDISQIDATSPNIIKYKLTSNIYNTTGTLKRIENKLYILGGSYGSGGKIYNIDDGTIEDVELNYSFTTIDTDFNIADSTVSIHSNSSPFNIVQFDIVIYSNQYKIYNNNGLVEYANYRGQAPIVSLKFEKKENNAIEYTIRTEEKNIIGSYITQTPNNLTLLGYSSLPNSSVVQYPLDREINISIKASKDLYEVYGMDIPVISAFDIYLYKNSAEQNRVDKSLYLTRIGIVSGTLRDDTSITNMAIKFEYPGIIDFNYVYIPIFNRYYFVNDVISLRNNIWNINLSVDVLMSYKDAIYNLEAFIDRNENVKDNLIVDKNRAIDEGYDYEVDTVENSIFDTTIFDYVLTGLILSSEPKEE